MRKKREFLGKRYRYLLLAGLCLSSFTTQAKQNVSISLNKPQTTIRDVLNEIEKKTDYSFVYNDRIIDANKIVSISTKDKALVAILDEVFEESNVAYTILDNQIVLSKSADAEDVNQQKRTVKGSIKDAEGIELTGVSIIVKGEKIGTTSDLDGNFSLEVPDNATLVLSYIGYLPQEVKVGDKTSLNITLKEDNQALDEVVVVGYTTQKKADLTGAVSSVKMSNLTDMSTSGINSALQGRMSGVTVLQSSGAPGAGTSIRIRGMGTFGNNDPLYVIDGMPADNMNDVNPSDIDRIDVLKDAASAAIYGSRAANGVVIIQTKKGSKSDKVNITFNTYQGFSTPQKKLKLLNAKERNMIHLEAYENDFNSLINPTQKQIDTYNKNIAYYKTPFAQDTRTNWQDEVFSDAAYQGNYDLSVAGGTEKVKYNIMAGHLNQNGILKETNFARTTFRVNTETEIIKNLKFGENLMITHSKQKIVPDMSASGAIISALRADPSVTIYDEDGDYSGSGELGADIQNPVGIVNRADRKRTRDRIFGNIYAQYKFFNDFTLKTDFGYDWSKWQDKWFNSRVPEAGRASDTNELTQRDWQSTRWINTTTLKYDKVINQHKLMVLGGFSYEEYDMDYTNARGTDFISEDPSQRYLSAATKIAWMQGGREQWALQSYFTRLDYSFADRYLLSVNFRADGSSKFSKDNRWGYFPSVSGGWRISEEPFFESLKSSSIENLKIRASWGKLGNQNIFSNYPTKVIIQNTTDKDGYNVVFGQEENATIGRYEASMANPNLKWEVSTQTDLGFDVSFLGKFEFGFDYYTKKATNVLIQVPAPSLAGLTEDPWRNAAEVQNKGIDLNLSYNTKVSGLDLNVYGNLSTVKNKVLSLGTGNSSIFTSSYQGTNISRTRVGDPIAHFYGYKTGGIFRSEEEVNNYRNSKGELYQPNAKPGDLKFLDVNGDDKIDGNDRTNIGSGFPKFTYGLGADLAYKGFDLSFFFQGVSGYDIFNALKYEGMFVNPRYNQYSDIQNRYHPVNNPNGNLPRVTIDDANGNKQMSDYYVDKGDYLRLKSLTVGYSLDRNLVKKIGIQKVRFYITMQNLFTITKYKGYDPDLGEAYADDVDVSGVSEVGVDRGQFPQPKSFIMGLNINF